MDDTGSINKLTDRQIIEIHEERIKTLEGIIGRLVGHLVSFTEPYDYLSDELTPEHVENPESVLGGPKSLGLFLTLPITSLEGWYIERPVGDIFLLEMVDNLLPNSVVIELFDNQTFFIRYEILLGKWERIKVNEETDSHTLVSIVYNRAIGMLK